MFHVERSSLAPLDDMAQLDERGTQVLVEREQRYGSGASKQKLRSGAHRAIKQPRQADLRRHIRHGIGEAEHDTDGLPED